MHAHACEFSVLVQQIFQVHRRISEGIPESVESISGFLLGNCLRFRAGSDTSPPNCGLVVLPPGMHSSSVVVFATANASS